MTEEFSTIGSIVQKMRNWTPPEKEEKKCPYCNTLMEAIKHTYPFKCGDFEEEHWHYEYLCPNDCEAKRQAKLEYAKKYRNAKNVWNKVGLSRDCVFWNLNKINCEHADFIRKYAENFGRFSKAIVMIGTKGTGKSISSECVVKFLLRKGKRCRVTSMSEVNMEMNQAIRNDKYNEYMNDVLKYDLIVLDDFGREQYTTEKSTENVFQFFKLLTNQRKPYIVSINPEILKILVTKPQFNAILDRFKDSKRVEVLKFTRDSFRK